MLWTRVNPNALPCGRRWRGREPRGGGESQGQPVTVPSGVPTGRERGRPCPTLGAHPTSDADFPQGIADDVVGAVCCILQRSHGEMRVSGGVSCWKVERAHRVAGPSRPNRAELPRSVAPGWGRVASP